MREDELDELDELDEDDDDLETEEGLKVGPELDGKDQEPRDDECTSEAGACEDQLEVTSDAG